MATLDPSATKPALGRTEFVALVALIMALNAAAIDVFVPALTAMSDDFGLGGGNAAQFVITSYVIGFGAAQIVYGPLADRFGRRPVLLAGLGIYIVASFAATFAPSFEVLLWMRFVQGIGAAATRVVAMALVRDRFEGAEMASVMSLVMMVFMIMPIVAPNLGALVLLVGDWHGLGLLMGAIGVIAGVWSFFRLSETLDPANKRPLSGARVAEAFRIVLTNRMAACYTGAMAAFFGVLFSFIGQAEQIFKEVYGFGEGFTLWFSLVALCMAGSSFANSRLAQSVGIRRLSQGALMAFAAIGAVHLVLALAFGGATPFPLFLLLFIAAMCCFGFVPPNLNALAMQPMGHVAGVASAVLGAVPTVIGGAIGGLVAYLFDGTLIPLLIGFVIFALASLGLVAVAERGRLMRPDDPVRRSA